MCAGWTGAQSSSTHCGSLVHTHHMLVLGFLGVSADGSTSCSSLSLGLLAAAALGVDWSVCARERETRFQRSRAAEQVSPNKAA